MVSNDRALSLLTNNPRLLSIAQEVARQGSSTSSSVARVLQLNDGSVLRDLRTLKAHGLMSSHQATGSRGERFQVTGARARGVISRAVAAKDDGRLDKGTSFVLIATDQLQNLGKVLTDPNARGGVRWLAVCADSSVGGILALSGDTVAARASVLAELRRGGVDGRPVSVEMTLGNEILELWAEEATGAGPEPESRSLKPSDGPAK